jgi:hypothetical protein
MSSKTYLCYDMFCKFWFSSKIVYRMWRNIPIIVHRNTTAGKSRTLRKIWIYWVEVIIQHVSGHRAISRWYVCSFSSFFLLIPVCEAIGTTATPGLLWQPRVIVKMIVEKQMECRLAGETEVLEGNLPQRHFCPSQNPTWPDPGLNPGRRGGKPATNRLSYGAALVFEVTELRWLLY